MCEGGGGWRGRGQRNWGVGSFSTCRCLELFSLVDFLLLAAESPRGRKKYIRQLLMIVLIGSIFVPVLSVQSCRTGCPSFVFVFCSISKIGVQVRCSSVE